MAALPALHVRQQLFHQPYQAKEVCIEELLHGSDALALQWSNHANTSIVHCNSSECPMSLYACKDILSRVSTAETSLRDF